MDNIEMKPATFQRKISSNIMKDKILITQLGKGGYKDTIYVYQTTMEVRRLVMHLMQ